MIRINKYLTPAFLLLLLLATACGKDDDMPFTGSDGLVPVTFTARTNDGYVPRVPYEDYDDEIDRSVLIAYKFHIGKVKPKVVKTFMSLFFYTWLLNEQDTTLLHLSYWFSTVGF